MKSKILKRGPTVVVTILGLVCTLPYLLAGEDQEETPPAVAAEETKEKDLPKTKEVQLTLQQLLQPKLVDRPTRDPFKDPAVLEAEAKALVLQGFKDFLARNVLKSPDGKFPTGSRTNKSKAAGLAAAKAKAVIDPRDSLVLNATYVLSDRGAAMINGELYRPGDAIRGLKVPDLCLVGEISRDRVVLRFRGATYPLVYKAATGKRVATVSSRKPAAAGPAPSKGRKRR